MLSVRLTCLQEVPVMTDHNVQQVFQNGYADYTAKNPFLSDVQRKAAKAILLCKTDKLGFQASFCTNCAHLKIHYRSCRNRNCPSCQAFTQIKSFYTIFCIAAVPKPCLSFLRIQNGLVLLLPSYRFFILGIRNLAIMSICIVSFPAEA